MIKKVIIAIIIVILILFIKSRIEILAGLKNTNDTLTNVKKELTEEKNNNSLLKEQLKYVTSDKFIEGQAREKLNLTKKNEALVINTNRQNKEKTGLPKEKNQLPWQKWFKKFF